MLVSIGSKWAFAFMFDDICRDKGFALPANSPDHPLNSYPGAGVAEMEMTEFSTYDPAPFTVPCPMVRISNLKAPQAEAEKRRQIKLKIEIKKRKIITFNER